jgi:hypothetical protein
MGLVLPVAIAVGAPGRVTGIVRSPDGSTVEGVEVAGGVIEANAVVSRWGLGRLGRRMDSSAPVFGRQSPSLVYDTGPHSHPPRRRRRVHFGKWDSRPRGGRCVRDGSPKTREAGLQRSRQPGPGGRRRSRTVGMPTGVISYAGPY